MWDRLHAAPFVVDVSLQRIRGLAIDWVMHCPDWDGMWSISRARYTAREARTPRTWLA